MNTRQHSFLKLFLMICLAACLALSGVVHAQEIAEALVVDMNFEGDTSGWQLEQGWSVDEIEGGHALRGSGHAWARFSEGPWADYHYTFRLKLDPNASLHANIRVTGAARYFITLDGNSSSLSKQTSETDFFNELAKGKPVRSGWHTVEIAANQALITVNLDGKPLLSYTDPAPLVNGRLAFESLSPGNVWIDDLQVFAPQVVDSGLEWVRLGGPLGGLGYDIRMRPDNPDIMYVTDANTGVYMSTDGGITWVPKNEGIDLRGGTTGDIVPVFSLTIDPNSYDTIWIGLQSVGGVYRSTDGGQTWEKRVIGITERNCLTVRGITIEPGNSDTVYIAGEICSAEWSGQELMGRQFDRTKGFVYKSTDAGLHWKAVWKGDNLARYIWIDPRDHNVLYVSTGIFDREAANTDVGSNQPGGLGILKSTDGGSSWKVLDAEEGLTGLYISSLFMHPKNPGILLAGAGHDYWSMAYDQGNREISPSGVFLSADGGVSWTQTLAHEQIYSVEYCLGGDNVAYAAGPNSVQRSLDGGRTWQRVSGASTSGGYWGPPGIVAGFPIDIQCDPRDSNRIFVNNYGGGNLLSEDGGATWTNSSQGYSGAIMFGGLALDRNNPAHLYAAARSGLFSSGDGGLTWSGLAYKPARHAEAISVAVSPVDGNLMLSAPWDLNQVVRSTDGGQSWTLVQQNPRQTQVIGLKFSLADPQTAYAAFGEADCKYVKSNCSQKGAGLYVSHDTGQTWQPANDVISKEQSFMALAIHPTDSKTVYAGSPKGLFRTMDGGKSWQQLDLQKPVWSLAIDKQDTQHIFAGTSSGMYISQDGGTTWKASSAGLPPESKIKAIAIDPTDSQKIWIGDYFSGVYFSTDGGTHWNSYNKGLTNRAITDLALSADGETLYASTHGGGTFRYSTHDQAYFDLLAPTPTPPPSPTPPPPQTPAQSAAAAATPKAQAMTPATATEQAGKAPLPCPSPAPLALVGLSIIGLVNLRRRSNGG
jgi:photosystem II stability/assembly factor-like uncharacterized protein